MRNEEKSRTERKKTNNNLSESRSDGEQAASGSGRTCGENVVRRPAAARAH